MKIVKYADGASSRPLLPMLIINSAVVFQGGVVKLVAGGVDGADAVSDPIFGICQGFVVKGGMTNIDNALAGDYDGTYSAGVSYTASADNQTDKQVKALVEIILPGDIIRAELDAAPGTTTGSDLIGYFVDVLTSDERKLDESNTHATNQLQFQIVGQAAGNFVDVILVENQINGAVQA